MSNPLDDYVNEHEPDLLDSFVQDDENWKLIVDWLFEKKQDDVRYNLFSKFLEDYKSGGPSDSSSSSSA